MRFNPMSMAFLASMALCIAGCDRTESDWKQAKDANNVPAYTDFIAKHPQGAHIDEAKAEIETLDWAQAHDANTPEGYREFLKNHPEGPHTSEAMKVLEQPEWDSAHQAGTADAYATFHSKYPMSQLPQQAVVKAMSDGDVGALGVASQRWRLVDNGNILAAFCGSIAALFQNKTVDLVGLRSAIFADQSKLTVVHGFLDDGSGPLVNSWLIAFAKGVLAEEVKDYDGARHFYEQANAMKPGNERIKSCLAVLELKKSGKSIAADESKDQLLVADSFDANGNPSAEKYVASGTISWDFDGQHITCSLSNAYSLGASSEDLKASIKSTVGVQGIGPNAATSFVQPGDRILGTVYELSAGQAIIDSDSYTASFTRFRDVAAAQNCDIVALNYFGDYYLATVNEASHQKLFVLWKQTH